MKTAPTSSPHLRRVHALQSALSPHTAVVISHPDDLEYFTGSGPLVPLEVESLLFVTATTIQLLRSPFSPASKLEPEISATLSMRDDSITRAVSQLHTEHAINTLALDEHFCSLHLAQQIKKGARDSSLEFTSLDRDIIWKLRMRKEPVECAAIRQAAQISATTLATVRRELAIGMTEIQVAARIKQLFISQFASEAFPTIVGFGENGALPHHQPTQAKLTQNCAVLIDMGARFDGYCSDMTRSFWFGDTPSQQFKRVEAIVHSAYELGVKTLSGVYSQESAPTAKEIDAAVRTHITDHKFGKQFIHTTGHGLGIGIHEPPSLGWSTTTSIERGMALTIEPGIYLPGEFGYRHENTFLVGEEKLEAVTQLVDSD